MLYKMGEQTIILPTNTLTNQDKRIGVYTGL